MNPADLMTEPLPRLSNWAAYEFYSLSIIGAVQRAIRDTSCAVSVSPTNCRMKFDHGVLAVGHSNVDGTDDWMAKKSQRKC